MSFLSSNEDTKQLKKLLDKISPKNIEFQNNINSLRGLYNTLIEKKELNSLRTSANNNDMINL